MGKGQRVRARRVERALDAPGTQQGAAFGLGAGVVRPPRGVGSAPVGTQGLDVAANVPAGPDRVLKSLERLSELAAARAELLRELHTADEEIVSAVSHLRVDGASWSRIGAVLGITRQGARQRFGTGARR